MKFMIKTIAFWGAIASLIFLACSDDDDNQNTPADFLTATSCWTQVKGEWYIDSTNSWLAFYLPDCADDDCLQFKNDNTWIMDRGVAKCDSTEAQTLEGTWKLSADGNTVTYTRNDLGNFLIYTVTELSDNKMVVETDFLGSKSRDTYEAK